MAGLGPEEEGNPGAEDYWADALVWEACNTQELQSLLERPKAGWETVCCHDHEMSLGQVASAARGSPLGLAGPG